jgi:uncharacterized protein YjbI with pentapeptide repeats
MQLDVYTTISVARCARSSLDREKRPMADASHLNVLKQGVIAWNDWQGRNFRIDADLSEADLRERNLTGAIFFGVDFTKADLAHAILVRCNLKRTRFVGAKLTSVDFAEAMLGEADFSSADLSSAHNLTQEQVDSAHGNEATKLPEGIVFPTHWESYEHALRSGVRTANEWRKLRPDSRLDLSGMSFSGADLRGIDLRGCNMRRCAFVDADLSEANLGFSELGGAVLDGASLRGTNFESAVLRGASLIGCTKLVQSQLEFAFGDDSTRLPHGVFAPLHWSKYRNAPLWKSIRFDLQEGSLREHLRQPLSRLAGRRSLVIAPQDGEATLFTTEDELPATDLRRAKFFVLNSRWPHQELGKVRIGRSNVAVPFFADVSIVSVLDFISDSGRMTAQCMMELTRGAKRVLQKLEAEDLKLEALRMTLKADARVDLGREFSELFGDSEFVAVENLFILIPAPKTEHEELMERNSLRYSSSVSARAAHYESVVALIDNGPERVVDPELLSAVSSQDAVAEVESRARSRHPEQVGARGEEDVICSVFAPPVVFESQEFDIQVMLHLKQQLLAAVREAAGHDSPARRRAYGILEARLSRGDEITLYLDSSDLVVTDPIATATWWGELRNVRFRVRSASQLKATLIQGTVHLYLAEIPIAEVAFELAVTKGSSHTETRTLDAPLTVSRLVSDAPINDAHTPTLVSTRASRYRTAFLSYSRKDVAYASIFAEGLTSNGISLFVDVTAMEPGDDWKSTIARAIEEADVFFLLWSRNAEQSKWVWQECDEACKRREVTQGIQPKIRPMVIGKRVSKPPYCIAELHCDSRWRAMRMAGTRPLFSRR